MKNTQSTIKTGFDRLRGVAAVSAVGLGLLGGGSARAAVTTLPLTVTKGTALWSSIGNLCAPNTVTTVTTGGCLMHAQSITTTGGFSLTSSMIGYGISDADLTGPGLGDFYDGGMSFAVGNVIFLNPDTTVDLTGDTVTSDAVVDIIPGVDAQIEYYFHPTRAVVRGLYTLTNTTGAPIMTSALVMGNYGSDDTTTVQATESGDLVVTDADRWVVTNDEVVVGDDSTGDPTATIASYGSGATVMPKTVMTLGTPAGGASAEPDNYGYRYDVTIPAMGTVRILVFNEMTTTIADATAGAADFESLAAADAAGLLTGLTAQVQSEIVNYGTAQVAVVTNKVNNDNDGIFALGLPGLLGALGSLLLFRQRNRKDRQ